MKIAILSIFFPPKWLGGTEVATLELSRELAKNKKNKIYIITSHHRELKKLKEKFKLYPIKVLNLPKFKVISYIIKTTNIIKKINPNVVYCQSTLSGVAAFFSKKPYVVYCRGSDIYLTGKIKNKINKFVLKRAEKVIALTKNMQKKIKKDYKIDSIVIYNGIDISKYKLNKAELKKRFKLKDEKVIIYIGTLKKVKGVEYLIKSFKNINKKFQNTKLWIIGDGSERRNLEALTKKLNLQNKITFFGKKSNDKIPKYAIASDILVLPSLSEGFPMAILEAMASGLPIVASNVTGVSEIIKDKINGFLVKPKNSKEIAEKVSIILKNKNLQSRFRKNNLKEVKKYSWKKTGNQLEKVYKQIL